MTIGLDIANFVLQSDFGKESSFASQIYYLEDKVKKDKNKDLEKYQNDLSVIKDILIKSDEVLYVEYWAFFTWGVFILIASLLHFLTYKFLNYNLNLIFTRVWVPILLLGAFFETIAWRIKNAKENIPLTSKTNLKLISNLTACFIAMCFIIYMLVEIQALIVLPVIVMLLLAMCMFIIGQQSYNVITYTGIFLVISAVIIYFFQLPLHPQCVVVSTIIGLAFLVSGYLAKLKEREKNEQ